MTIKKFQNIILHWYKTNRRDMPWRNTNDPYKILVSEIMLQQTQVARVIPKYKEFLRTFPTLLSFARAKDTRVLKIWQGLGYWRRAKYLKQTAQKILDEAKKTNSQMSPRRPTRGEEKNFSNRGGWARLPSKARKGGNDLQKFFSAPEELETLPGIGHYTARALACFAFGNTEAFLDTNIRRIYLHFFFKNKTGVLDKEILPIAQKAVDTLPRSITPRNWHYALFDYGAMVLKNKEINKQSKHYHKQSTFKGSFRSFRTKVMQFLLRQPRNKTTRKKLTVFLENQLTRVEPLHAHSPQQIIDSLLKDNLIKQTQTHYSL